MQGVVLRERILVYITAFTLMAAVGQGARVLLRKNYSLDIVEEIPVDDGDGVVIGCPARTYGIDGFVDLEGTNKPPFCAAQGTYNAFAADVWAAGVCLWVFRFGTPPFYDPDPSTLFLDICGQPLHFPVNADEGDEEVIAAEKEAEELAKARASQARAEAAAAAVAKKGKRQEEGDSERHAQPGLGRESSDGDVASLRPIEIPEYSPANEDDLDLQSPGQLPALGRYSGKRKKSLQGLRRSGSGAAGPSSFDTSASGPITPAPRVHLEHGAVYDHLDGDGQRRSLSASAVGGPSTHYGLSNLPDGLSTPPRASPVPLAPPGQQWFRRCSRSNRLAGARSSSVDAPSASRKPPRGSDTMGGHAVEAEGERAVGGGRAQPVGVGSGSGSVSRSRSGSCYLRSLSAASSIREDRGVSGPVSGSRCSIEAGGDASQLVSSATGPPRSPSPSPGDLGEGALTADVYEDTDRDVGGRSERPSGTLRDLLTSLLNKRVSERTTVRGAQEHPWMTRMCPRNGEGVYDEAKGSLRREPPPLKQVSVTAGEVNGAIVHINSLFVISMVKSRLTQRLTRARKNIARRRLQATTGERYGPSLSDTEQREEKVKKDRRVVTIDVENKSPDSVKPKGQNRKRLTTAQKLEMIRLFEGKIHVRAIARKFACVERTVYNVVGKASEIWKEAKSPGCYGKKGIRTGLYPEEHLREVRDLTEALTKDESVLVNHQLANEPERSLSDSDLPTATYSGTWPTSSHRSHGRRGRGRESRHGDSVGLPASLAHRLYQRSASRLAGRDSVHTAINNFFGHNGLGTRHGHGHRRSSHGRSRRRSERQSHGHGDRRSSSRRSGGGGSERRRRSSGGHGHGHSHGRSSRHGEDREGRRRRSSVSSRHEPETATATVSTSVPDDGSEREAQTSLAVGDAASSMSSSRILGVEDGSTSRSMSARVASSSADADRFDREREYRSRHRRGDKHGDREEDRDGHGHQDGDGHKHRERAGDLHRSRDRDRQRDRDRGQRRDHDGERNPDRDQERHRECDRNGERHRDRKRDGERHRNRDVERHRDRDRDRDRDGERQRNRDREGERPRDRDRDRDRDGERQRNRDRDGERHRNRDRDGERHRNRDRDGERHRNRDREGERHRNRDRDRERHRDRDRDRERCRDRDRDQDAGRHLDRERGHQGHRRDSDGGSYRDRERKRDPEPNGEHEQNVNGGRQEEREAEFHQEEDTPQDGGRGGELHRSQDSERHRERHEEHHRDQDNKWQGHRDAEEHQEGQGGERQRDKGQDQDEERQENWGEHQESQGGEHQESQGGEHQENQGGEHQENQGGVQQENQGGKQQDHGGKQQENQGEKQQENQGEKQQENQGEKQQENQGGEQQEDQGGEHQGDQRGNEERQGEQDGEPQQDNEGERHRLRDAERRRDRSQEQQRSRSLAILSKGAVSGSARRQGMGSASSDVLTLAPSSSTVGARSSLGIGGSSGCSRHYSRSYSTQSLVSVSGCVSPSGSESGSLSSDFSPSDAEASFPDVSDDERGGVSAVRLGVMGSFGSEGSSRSGHSGRSRGSFKVFGITRRTLQLKNMRGVPRMTIPRLRRPNGSGGLHEERDEGSANTSVNASANASANVTPVKAPAKQDSALGRLSGGVLGKKRLKNGKSSGSWGTGDGAGAVIAKTESGGSIHGDHCASACSYGSMPSVASVASVASVGRNSSSEDNSDGGAVEMNTPGAEWNSDASSYYRPASRGGTRSAFVTAAATTPSKPPPGPSLAAAVAARRAHSAAVGESSWGVAGASIGGISGASSHVVGTRSSRRYRRTKKKSCDVS